MNRYQIRKRGTRWELRTPAGRAYICQSFDLAWTAYDILRAGGGHR